MAGNVFLLTFSVYQKKKVLLIRNSLGPFQSPICSHPYTLFSKIKPFLCRWGRCSIWACMYCVCEWVCMHMWGWGQRPTLGTSSTVLWMFSDRVTHWCGSDSFPPITKDAHLGLPHRRGMPLSGFLSNAWFLTQILGQAMYQLGHLTSTLFKGDEAQTAVT